MDELTLPSVQGDWPEARLQWAAARRPYPGEARCGDLPLAVRGSGFVLLALLDGLGHGGPAADAADRAAELLAAHQDEPLERLLQVCHQSLRPLRGAAISMARVATDRLEWTGVGNVQAVLRGANGLRHLIVSEGIVGAQMRKVRVVELPLEGGDELLLWTDGVSSAVTRAPRFAGRLGSVADELLSEFAHGTDDAAVLLLRVEGAA